MKTMLWGACVFQAIHAKDANTLARLLAENDPNGVYGYRDFCREFGKVSRADWEVELFDCGKTTLAELPQHLTEDECAVHAELLEKWAEID